jgi:GTP-binding protein YchF
MLKAGIVGLPNVGKSTLFNALTSSFSAESANYPFCTIEPNTGIVKVNDPRLWVLKEIARTNKVIPAVFEFVDIAGLVKGASKGEGLGNQFLANIREVDAVVHVVRCFEDTNIQHVEGSVDPVRDVETIMIELCLSDAASIEKRMPRLKKAIMAKDAEGIAEKNLMEKILPVVEQGHVVRMDQFDEDERLILKRSGLLCTKPILYAGNVAEGDLANPLANPHFKALSDLAASEGRPAVAISAQIEAELASFEDEAEKTDYLQTLGVDSSGVDRLIQSAFTLLGLKTYFTAGEKEVRAWPFKDGFKAPQCAGIIHTDFEKGFIRAEVISYEDYVRLGGEKGAKEEGVMRLEGKEYLVKDGDVMHFRFNV